MGYGIHINHERNSWYICHIPLLPRGINNTVHLNIFIVQKKPSFPKCTWSSYQPGVHRYLFRDGPLMIWGGPRAENLRWVFFSWPTGSWVFFFLANRQLSFFSWASSRWVFFYRFCPSPPPQIINGSSLRTGNGGWYLFVYMRLFFYW